ncbi:hypothetical protein L1987_43988 [Smallanthus sonchifolius]|uniref:Uncharacterized protein n=1 Tax=Smallanthus sonchifolius TaxID=185202 RepID=A0ACB9GPH7_9ASTR|nr:hypothetical protein L1987_43988 [Smallanthus sonchifolius]
MDFWAVFGATLMYVIGCGTILGVGGAGCGSVSFARFGIDGTGSVDDAAEACFCFDLVGSNPSATIIYSRIPYLICFFLLYSDPCVCFISMVRY